MAICKPTETTLETGLMIPPLEETPLFGQHITLSNKVDCLNYCKQQLANGQNVHVVTLNPEMLTFAKANPNYAEILRQAQLKLPDGIGLVWALKRKGINTQRLPGIEFSQALLQLAAENHWPVALIGGSPEVSAALCPALKDQYPSLDIAYLQHGYYQDEAAVVVACKAVKPKLILLALGFPRQEEWIAQYKAQFTEGAIFVGVGGSFDVWSGTKKRAPKLFRAFQLEWFYRIASEPWRLKRVMATLPQFFLKAVVLNHNEL